MYSVLVPVDRNEQRALSQARCVAGFPGAEENVQATVVYVVPPSEFETAGEVSFSDVDAAVRAADHLEEQGISVSRLVEDGSVAQQIIRTANDLDADELVMGGRKRSGVAQVLLGSTVQDVFLSSERPVTITGTEMVHADDRLNLILPVDGSEERARRQVEYVASLPLDPETVSVTVLYVFPHQDYRGAPEHEFEEVDAAVDAADQLADHGFSVDRVATGGEVVETIIEQADEHDADRMVVGGRKRSGVQKVLLGSTAQDLLLSADCPVTLTG